MRNDEYPKVLVVSSYKLYIKNNQTSITLNSYFGTWPKERIAQIVCGVFNEEEKGNLGNNTYILSLKEIAFLRLFLKEKRIPSATGDDALPVIPTNATLLFRLKRTFQQFLIATAELCPYIISEDLMRFISNFRPDVIYTTVESPRIIQLSRKIKSISDIKIIPHFMDDFPTTIFNTPITKIHRWFVLNKLKNLIATSPSCFCISDSMCTEYKKRYKKEEFYPLMNCVEKYYGDSLDNCKKRKVIKFSYVGGLHLKRDEVLIQLSKYLSQIKGIRFELNIYTQQSFWDTCKNQFSTFPSVNYGGYLNKEAMLAKMQQSDILVFVESFDSSVQDYTRFSVSTKIPEYLSTGKKILAIGPKGIASIDYLHNNNAAYIISDIGDLDAFVKVINSM
ncbi:MAG: hypothetical protein PHG42_05910, partial [Bacteroides sp.]|nr:hypothetical protein [Bacteroides sp.]